MSSDPSESIGLRSFPLRALCGAGLLAVAGASLPGVAQEQAASGPSALQVMADAVLIDAQCRNVPVNFGALLRYGQDHGIPAVAIMPLGALRKPFEAAFRHRAETVTPEVLCTTLVAQERALVPDVIRP